MKERRGLYHAVLVGVKWVSMLFLQHLAHRAARAADELRDLHEPVRPRRIAGAEERGALLSVYLECHQVFDVHVTLSP